MISTEPNVDDLSTYPTATVERLIARWQRVQKASVMESRQWRDASEALAPLFAEMARRQKGGRL